jgi:hypothetical protein
VKARAAASGAGARARTASPAWPPRSAGRGSGGSPGPVFPVLGGQAPLSTRSEVDVKFLRIFFAPKMLPILA